nr:gluconokinase [Delftia sp. PS-11]
MGVSGCGKSSVGQALADALGWTLHEGDAHHAEASIRKMQAGIPLTDEDRSGWLDTLAHLLGTASPHQGVVLTCSALKRKYRNRLRQAAPAGGVGFVFLDLDYETALQRVQERAGHFFSPELVANQFATLERPDGECAVLSLDATLALAEIVQQAQAWLQPVQSLSPLSQTP